VSTSQKVLLSLLITVILSTAFTVFAFIGMFDLIETSFYNPSVTAHMVSENNRNAKVIGEFFKDIENRLSETLETDAVQRSLAYDQSQEDFSAINNIFSRLGNSFEGIHWVRLIDSSGKRLYFSSYSQDIVNNDYKNPAYRSYSEPDIPYELIAVQNGGLPKHTFDNKSGGILFSFPLYDSFDIYCGTALFSLSMDAILEKLFSEGRILSSHEITLIQKPPGMVFGTMAADESVMPSQISSVWETTGLKTVRVSSNDSGVPYILVSTKTSQDLFIGSIIKEELYQFSWSMKLILLISFFLTVYLTVFLLFSLKQEPVAIIQNRLKRLQVSLLEQFYETKDEEDWNRWVRELKHRKEEISALLKQGIRPASRNLDEEIDILINKSWGEFLTLLGSRRESGFDVEKLRSALNSVLAALPKEGKDLISGGEAPQAKKAKTGLLGRASAIVQEIEETDPVEELEELEEVEELEGIKSKEASEVDIDALASQIEFSPETQPEPAGDDSIENDLEIVSPFSAMLDDFTDTIDYEDPEQEDVTTHQGTVIKEKGGLPFVSADALNQDEKEAEYINRDFKNLVDSVIKD
jgi:hypothetical protein